MLRALAGAAVDPRQQAAVAAGVEDVGVFGIRRDVAALAAADVVELAAAGARHAGGAVVLLRAADVIRHVRGGEDVVELRGRKVLVGPGLAAVDRDVGAAVVALDHAACGRSGAIHRSWLSPCGTRMLLQRLAAVGRLIERHVEDVDRVLRLRVGVDARVVEGALPDVAVVVHQLPRRARVVRQEHAAVLRLDDRVDAIGVGAGDR